MDASEVNCELDSTSLFLISYGGSLSKALTGTTQFGRLASYGLLLGTSVGFDKTRGANDVTTGTDVAISLVTFGAGDYLYPTPSVTTISQLRPKVQVGAGSLLPYSNHPFRTLPPERYLGAPCGEA